MKVLVCSTCRRAIKKGLPFWQAYYSKQTFCCAECAALAQGCTRYTVGKEYDQIFNERSPDAGVLEMIEKNTETTDLRRIADRMRSESTDYRFDLDF